MNTLIKGALALGVAGAALTTPASATHSWGGYHWARPSNPFTLKLGDNVSSNWDSYLGVASADWSQSGVLDTVVVPGGSGNVRRCSATTGRVEVCNSTYGNTGWLGIASISITGSVHITSGTVKQNDTYFNQAQYNSPAWRQMVMCQEIGHTFGLDHQDTAFDNPNLGTCMDYTNDPSTNQHPNAHDYDELITIYNHGDSSTTIGAAIPTGIHAEIGNSPKSWGRPVHFMRDGRPDQYMRLDGPGRFTLTHVLWARGKGPADSNID
ncbi:MAG: hypothetical protein QFB89_06795 [Pseudomonadota bacterium]|nr:hypothetical protein [Pseudomonadota bacterium]